MVEPENYAELVKKAEPHFLEVKAYMFVGASRQKLDKANMPYHKDIVEFAKKIEKNSGYKIIDEQQQLLQRRFHKGWQLHNWGVALLNLDRQEEGYGKILLAYVEDVLTVEAGSEDDADNGLAGKTLRDAGEEEGLLRAVKEIARRRKEAGEPTFVPDLILNEAQARPRARLTATGTLEPLQLLSS